MDKLVTISRPVGNYMFLPITRYVASFNVYPEIKKRKEGNMNSNFYAAFPCILLSSILFERRCLSMYASLSVSLSDYPFKFAYLKRSFDVSFLQLFVGLVWNKLL
jgi:hypothetical protein